MDWTTWDQQICGRLSPREGGDQHSILQERSERDKHTEGRAGEVRLRGLGDSMGFSVIGSLCVFS